jgi:hypothetical protein
MRGAEKNPTPDEKSGVGYENVFHGSTLLTDICPSLVTSVTGGPVPFYSGFPFGGQLRGGDCSASGKDRSQQICGLSLVSMSGRRPHQRLLMIVTQYSTARCPCQADRPELFPGDSVSAEAGPPIPQLLRRRRSGTARRSARRGPRSLRRRRRRRRRRRGKPGGRGGGFPPLFVVLTGDRRRKSRYTEGKTGFCRKRRWPCTSLPASVGSYAPCCPPCAFPP